MASTSSTCVPLSTKAHLLVSLLAEAASMQAAMLPIEVPGKTTKSHKEALALQSCVRDEAGPMQVVK